MIIISIWSYIYTQIKDTYPYTWIYPLNNKDQTCLTIDAIDKHNNTKPKLKKGDLKIILYN